VPVLVPELGWFYSNSRRLNRALPLSVDLARLTREDGASILRGRVNVEDRAIAEPVVQLHIRASLVVAGILAVVGLTIAIHILML
jgi:hypothetical protein